MAFSTQRVTSDGTLSSLDLSIDYFERDEISVFFDNIVDALPWAWVGLTEKTISFSPDVPNGVEVLVRRTTPLAEVFHDFDGGAAFVAKTVDENFKQVLHIAQEAVEGGTTGDFFNDLNMHGYKITNLANPVDPGDAVNLSRFTLQENLVITYRDQTIVYRDQAEDFAIAAAASASSVDTATLLARANHTGTQTASTISDLGDAAVLRTGNQSKSGVLTFSDSPIVPTPTTNFQVCTKAYADTVAASVSAAAVSAAIAPATLAPTLVVAGTAIATTSGTSIDFTGIPSWVQRISICLAGVSTTGTATLLVQIGDSGGIETSGYNATAAGIVAASGFSNSTSGAGFPIYGVSASDAKSGVITLSLLDASSNTWCASGVVKVSSTTTGFLAGDKSLSGTLDRLRITTNTAETFDAGQINVMWE